MWIVPFAMGNPSHLPFSHDCCGLMQVHDLGSCRSKNPCQRGEAGAWLLSYVQAESSTVLYSLVKSAVSERFSGAKSPKNRRRQLKVERKKRKKYVVHVTEKSKTDFEVTRKSQFWIFLFR